MDLDHFKKINDVHGHHVGDEVLKTFSEIVQKRIRSLDSFGRIGGEEFCLFLSDTDKEQAEFVAKNLLSLFQKTPISALSGTVHFTASIGISTMNEKYENVDQWLQDADKALYHAKNTGRNRACHIDDIKQESTLSSEHAREAKR
jgi:diguanylate cyclase (GGDEF)-like protein